MDYNSQREHLIQPEYGRLVQQMVDYAVSIEDRGERQQIAEVIVRVMGSFFPGMRGVPDFNHKLWDHLAAISKHRLDIDYPVKVSESDESPKAETVPYPDNKIRYRHYGHLVEQLLAKIPEMENEEERNTLIKLTAERMKVNLVDSKGEGVEDVKVFDDIAFYTDGKVVVDAEKMLLSKVKPRPQDSLHGNARGRRGKRNM